MKVLIVGVGGHGQVVADILLSQSGGPWPAGFLDDDPALHGRTILTLPVLGPVDAWSRMPHDALIMAIGDNRTRARFYRRLTAAGERFVSAIHPSAVIGRAVNIEPGTVVCAGAIINTGCHIGPNSIINTAALVDHHTTIGSHVHIGPGARLGGVVCIGDGTLVGIGATVMPQRQIAEWSVLGAAALLTKDLPPRVTATGVPARIQTVSRSTGGR
jgi:sugar O-acyltransferase (sialic acid O-acetyltransferase NeuD family)